MPSSPSKCVAVNTRRRRSKDDIQRHDGDTNNEHIHIQGYEQKDQSLVQKSLEEKLMGHIEGEGRIGDSVERNINQMIEVLRSKISAMGNAAKTRLRLCQEDLNNNSSESSDQAPKITEDYEDSPKLIGTRDQDIGSYMHRDNLVLSEVVHINTAHLVIRTKAPTDAARKLELELEESYASSKQRCLGNMAGKSGQKKIEVLKKIVQKRSDARKIRRNKSEKDLQTNMEKFLTRSVMDADLLFRAPTAFTSPRQGSSFSCSSSVSNSAVKYGHGRGQKHEHGHVRASESCSIAITVPTAVRQSSSDQMNDQAGDAERMLSEAAYVTVPDEGEVALDLFKWPIAIKWPLGDPRSAHPGNAEVYSLSCLVLFCSFDRPLTAVTPTVGDLSTSLTLLKLNRFRLSSTSCMYWMFTVCTGCLPYVLDVYRMYWMFTVCTGCLPYVLDVCRMYWMFTVCTGCLPYVLDVYRMYWMFTVCA